MAKSLAASQKVMKNYLSELLTDDEVVEPKKRNELVQNNTITSLENKPQSLLVTKENKSLETLLKNVSAPIEPEVAPLTRKPEVVNVDLSPITTQKSSADKNIAVEKEYRQGDFQAMFFDVAGLTIAVPLIELGGIHKVGKTNSLMGKPDWFKGVMLHRDDKINIVDTALWVMPEKCDEALKESLNYQYVIMLKDSSWGLMAENLVDTVILKQEEVKWLDKANKRPWLAGLVKEKMCALLDVCALIKLLDEGSGINQDK
jgi:purine-binding chemotaxis protein CheW